MLERLFRLSENRTNVRTEIIAGITTFMTMAYIIAVNPIVLCLNPAHPGPPLAATIAATCLAAALPCILMGLWANYPLALASGMGLNSLLIISVSAGGVSWQTMMGVVFVEGFIITVLVLTNLRGAIMNAIPMDLKRAIGGGIGLFIALLGMHSAHWMSTTKAIGGDPLTIPPVGSFHQPVTLLATFGILLTALLVARKVRGAFLLGIAATTVVAVIFHLAHAPAAILSKPDFSTVGKLDILGALQPGLVALVFAFLITDFFDTMGTVIAVTEQSGHLQPDGSLPRLNRVLLVDSLAAMWGGFCSASSVTTYIESASGVGEGGRTGLTSVVAGLLFLSAMFFAPLIGAVPPEATAAALIVVGFMMMATVREIDFKDYTTAIPAFLTLILIPLTMSISRGIGVGFIAYVALNLLSGNVRKVPVALWILAALFALSFWLERPPV
jgi:AGZA family xanthine/uracil permease-like MFS transporter